MIRDIRTILIAMTVTAAIFFAVYYAGYGLGMIAGTVIEP